MNLRLSTLILLLAAVAVIASCRPDYFDLSKTKPIEYSPSFALPLVDATLNVYDILDTIDTNEVFVVDENDGFVGLVYDEINESVNVTEFFEIPDESFSDSYTLNTQEIQTFQSNGSLNLNFDQTLTFSLPNDIELEEAILATGLLQIVIESTFEHSGQIEFTFPTITQGGVALSNTIPIDHTTGVPVNISEDFDLSEYTIDFTNGGTGTNELPVDINFSLSFSGAPIGGGDQISYTVSMLDLDFSSITGDFGNLNLQVPTDSILIRLFNNAIAGEFSLTNPTLNFTLENSYGIPFEVRFNALNSYNTVTEEILPLTGPGVDTPKLIEGASGPGQTATSSFTLNGENTTNIQEIISPTPKYLTYDVEVEANPDGPPPGLNFMTSDSKIDLRAELILPMEGWARDFVMQDTIDYNFSEPDNVDDIESLEFRTIITNDFPVQGDIQIYFLDKDNNTIIDSLFDDGITRYLEPATAVVGQDRITQPGEATTDILVESARIPTLVQAEQIIVQIRANTFNAANDQVVKFFADYKMRVQMGVKINLSLTLEDEEN